MKYYKISEDTLNNIITAISEAPAKFTFGAISALRQLEEITPETVTDQESSAKK